MMRINFLLNIASLGTVLIPGTTQLTQKDLLYRLQASKAKCIITHDALAPAVDAVAPTCENLHSKLIVSQNSREGWGNLKEMMKWVAFLVEQIPRNKGNNKKIFTLVAIRPMLIRLAGFFCRLGSPGTSRGDQKQCMFIKVFSWGQHLWKKGKDVGLGRGRNEPVIYSLQ